MDKSFISQQIDIKLLHLFFHCFSPSLVCPGMCQSPQPGSCLVHASFIWSQFLSKNRPFGANFLYFERWCQLFFRFVISLSLFWWHYVCWSSIFVRQCVASTFGPSNLQALRRYSSGNKVATVNVLIFLSYFLLKDS